MTLIVDTAAPAQREKPAPARKLNFLSHGTLESRDLAFSAARLAPTRHVPQKPFRPSDVAVKVEQYSRARSDASAEIARGRRPGRARVSLFSDRNEWRCLSGTARRAARYPPPGRSRAAQALRRQAEPELMPG
jgi:hypothetical protein